jgi:uncharacterized protein (TIGR02300 family)
LAKPEWGLKRTCFTCSARFYDLHRSPIVCPVCNAVYDPERQPRIRRGGTVIRDEPVLSPALGGAERIGAGSDDDLAEEEVEDVEEGADADADELATEDTELMEDTSELGEDVDDIGEVMEHVDDGLDEKT